MKKLVLATTALVVAGGLGLGLASAADMPTNPIKVYTEGGKKPAVTFDHQLHMDKNEGLKDNCTNCHHNGTETVEKAKCRHCHKIEPNDVEGKTAPKIKDAMHKKDVGKCWQCHRAEDAPHKMKCAECHVKE